MTRPQLIQYLIDSGYKRDGYGRCTFHIADRRVYVGKLSARQDQMINGRWKCIFNGWLSKMSVENGALVWRERSTTKDK